MIWLLATRGASTKLRDSPFTETAIEGVHSIIYRPGIEAVPCTGEAPDCERGEFDRGLHRISGVVFSYHGLVAEMLFAIADDIDLIIYYRANGEPRKRTLQQVIFLGDAAVAFPSLNDGRGALIGVPFRVQIKEGDMLADRIQDAADS